MGNLTGAVRRGAPAVQETTVEGSVLLRRSGLIFSRPPRFCTWEHVGQQLTAVANSSTWWMADWLAYGEATFHDRYREAVQRTSLDYQTLRNYVWVARRFEMSRRRDNLSFGHHAEVAALDQPEQDFWLRKADELGWSRNELRRQVRQSLRVRKADSADALPPGVAWLPRAGRDRRRPGQDPGPVAAEGPSGDDDEKAATLDEAGELRLDLTDDQFAQFKAAACTRQLGLEDWAIGVLEGAARLAPCEPRRLLTVSALFPAAILPLTCGNRAK